MEQKVIRKKKYKGLPGKHKPFGNSRLSSEVLVHSQEPAGRGTGPETAQFLNWFSVAFGISTFCRNYNHLNIFFC